MIEFCCQEPFDFTPLEFPALIRSSDWNEAIEQL